MEYHRGLIQISLAENLRELMTRNLFEKITIKQICDKTGVIRATFYNYFDDKYDCLNWIVYHDLAETYMSASSREDFESGIRHCLEVVEKNRAFYRAGYQVTGQNSFEDMIRANLKISLMHYFEQYRKPGYLEKYSNDLLASYYAETMAFSIRTFTFSRPEAVTIEDTRQMIMDLMKNSLYDFSAAPRTR